MRTGFDEWIYKIGFDSIFILIIFMFVNVYENVSINKKTKDRMEESKSKRNSHNGNIKYRNAEK